MTAEDVTNAELNGLIYGREQTDRVAKAGLSTDEIVVVNRAVCEVMNACTRAGELVGGSDASDRSQVRMLKVISEAIVSCGEMMGKVLSRIESQ